MILIPFYEYQCPKCGVFTEQQSIKDDSFKKCPKCKSSIKRLISSTFFLLRGEGWTSTDIRAANVKRIEKRLEVEEAEDARQGKITL